MDGGPGAIKGRGNRAAISSCRMVNIMTRTKQKFDGR